MTKDYLSMKLSKPYKGLEVMFSDKNTNNLMYIYNKKKNITAVLHNDETTTIEAGRYIG